MKTVKVSSTNLHRVGYDALKSRLWIQFKRTGSDSLSPVYCYSNVPRAIYDGLLSASSKGTFFGRAIRDVYAFSKHDDFPVSPGFAISLIEAKPAVAELVF